MLIILESILPIFLLVLLGVGLKRSPLIPESFWAGLEVFGYYVLFPALLFYTLAKTDFSQIQSAGVSLVSLLSVLAISAVTLALWPMLKAGGMQGPAFTSVFQTATRWNGFMALAMAEKLTGPIGLSVIAVVMATIIIPINLMNVGVMIWFAGNGRDIKTFVKRIISNPIILGAAFGVAVNLAGVPIYDPLMVTVDLVARTSLPLGLITVGAGLQIADALNPKPSVFLSAGLKLILFPLISVGFSLMFGLTGETLAMVTLAAAVPTAMNGYLLAKQMGGDADLYAAAATVQTVLAFVTVPIILALIAYAPGG